MDTAVSLGQWVRRRRKALDLTQEQLAARVGCSKELVAKIEADARRPSRQVAALLAEHLQLAGPERERFVHAARAELAPDRLPPATDVPLPHAPASSRAPATSRLRHNLPAQLTPLLGRAREVAELTELLARPDTRLVTLTGTGGVGKTRLALAAAEALLDPAAPLTLHRPADDVIPALLPDGAWYVDLAPLTRAAQIAGAIQRTLGLPEPDGAPEEALRAALRTRRLMLLLDGFEHLLDGAPLVSSLLHGAPGLSVLATSRAPLRLSGEHAWMVEPLDEPQAVALFVERGRSVWRGFHLSSTTGATVAEICRRLDGLPLAIELAAARTRLLAPAELLARLNAEGGLPQLTGGPRDAPARHRTVRAALEWSYRLLAPAEQMLFARLAVFAGGFAREAALSLQERPDDGPLGALVDHSLLQPVDGPAGERRFALLDTVREYALERLDERGEREDVRRLHAEHYATLAERAAPELEGPQQGEWRARLAADHANISAALTWSLEPGGEPTVGLRLAASLLWYWKPLGYRREAKAWLEALLAACPDAPAPIRAPALHAAGLLAARLGQYDRAVPLVEEALALCRNGGDVAGAATVLNRLCALAREQGQYDRAVALCEEALGFAREHRLDSEVMGALWGLGDVALERGDPHSALGWYQQAQPLVHACGDVQAEGWLLANAGQAWSLVGDYRRAAEELEAALALFERAGLRDGVCYMCVDLGRVVLARGDPGAAAPLLAEGLRLGRDLAMPHAVAVSLEILAELACVRGKPEVAARLLGAAHSAHAVVGQAPAALERATTDRAAGCARAALGDAAYDAAFAGGAALPLEQAITEALAVAE